MEVLRLHIGAPEKTGLVFFLFLLVGWMDGWIEGVCDIPFDSVARSGMGHGTPPLLEERLSSRVGRKTRWTEGYIT